MQLIQAVTAITGNSSSDFLAWTSISVTFILGCIAGFQAYHYNKLSNSSNKNIADLVGKINETVIELKATNKLLTDNFTKIIGKAIGHLGKAGTGAGDMKKDIEKAITDSSEKLEGKMKNVEQTLDKQGKESQVSIDDLKAQMTLLNDGVQKLFKIVMKQLEPEITEAELRTHIIEKIGHLAETLTFCSFKDLTQVIAHQDISYDKIIGEIKKMKEEGLITYDGDEIFNDTKITIVKSN